MLHRNDDHSRPCMSSRMSNAYGRICLSNPGEIILRTSTTCQKCRTSAHIRSCNHGYLTSSAQDIQRQQLLAAGIRKLAQ